jgi:hypothetical protein
MNRRDFILAAGATAAFPAFGFNKVSAESSGEPGDFVELIKFQLIPGEKKNFPRDFFKNAAIPALNKMGISPVGVFNVQFGSNAPSLYVMIPHKTIDSFLTMPMKMLEDEDIRKNGKDFIDAPMSSPAFARMEKILYKAFKNLPSINVPEKLMKNPKRIYELRIYESHSRKAARKKIEMFNEGGEIDIFKKTGLFPVFFGETLAGTLMPNLTYMVAFNDLTERDKTWEVFVKDPDWLKISSDPQYKDIVSNITDFILTPDECSQF